jgi:CCR4-NOT transcription complex subunit 9
MSGANEPWVAGRAASSPVRGQSPGGQVSPSPTAIPPAGAQSSGPFSTEQLVYQIKRLHKSESERADAVQILWANSGQLPDLALALWYSPATMTSLLTDVLGFFPQLVAAKIFQAKADNVYLILQLFQLIAAHLDTRLPFVRANIPVYLSPILRFTLANPENERFVGVIIGILSHLVKDSQPEVIESLIRADFVPQCLRVLRLTKDIIQVASAYVLSKIFSVPGGKRFLSEATPENIAEILKVLNQVLLDLSREKDFTSDLSRWTVACYEALLTVPQVVQIVPTLVAEISTITMRATWDESYRNLIAQLKTATKRPTKS